MKIKANQKLTKAKRKVKMRGFYTPMPCIFILGFLHKKRKLVKSGENGPVSPYIIRKEKDFHEYLAKLYQVTAQHMEGLKAEKLHAAEKVFEIERILEEYSEDKKEDKVMDIMQCSRLSES